MKIRRQFTPPETSSGASPSNEAQGVHSTRRGGARHELNVRVLLRPHGDGAGPGTHVGSRELDAEVDADPVQGRPAAAGLEGWALNVSRGGLRIILEERVQLGAEFDVAFSDGLGPTDTAGAPVVATPCRGRVVWLQEEPDGVVVGIEFRPEVVAGS